MIGRRRSRESHANTLKAFAISAQETARMRKLIVAVGVAIALAASSAQAEEVVSYTVLEGENVETIAGKFNVTVEELTVSNGLDAEEFVADAVILIPPKHATGYYDPQAHVYTVAEGDDLYAIAKRFGVTIETLKKDNGLEADTIDPGETLTIGF
jgi:LysM repeat protein